jgi:hypothetical protein
VRLEVRFHADFNLNRPEVQQNNFENISATIPEKTHRVRFIELSLGNAV